MHLNYFRRGDLFEKIDTHNNLVIHLIALGCLIHHQWMTTLSHSPILNPLRDPSASVNLLIILPLWLSGGGGCVSSHGDWGCELFL